MKKLKPAGILALVAGSILALSILGLIGRSIWSETRTLGGMDPVSVEYTPPSQVPKDTPVPSSPVPSTPEPLPEGWSIERDPFSGDNYLAPSFEVETAVREAFQAVLSLDVIEDRPNEEALAFDPDTARAQAREFATEDVVARYAHLDFVELGAMGPRNSVQCQDYDTCTVVQVKTAVLAYVGYDPDMCAGLDAGIPAEHKGADGKFLLAGDGSHCVTRFVENDGSIVIYAATVELDGDRWIVTDLVRDPM